MSVADGIKLAGEVLRENKETMAQVGRVGVDEVLKHKSKGNAKTRYADYLAFKSSDYTDVEEFAYYKAETTGRDWAEICENIRFHMQRNGEKEVSKQPVEGNLLENPPKSYKEGEGRHFQPGRFSDSMPEEGKRVSLEMTPSNPSTGRTPPLTMRDMKHFQTGGKFEVDMAPSNTIPVETDKDVDALMFWQSELVSRHLGLSTSNGYRMKPEDWTAMFYKTASLLGENMRAAQILSDWYASRESCNTLAAKEEVTSEDVSEAFQNIDMKRIYPFICIPNYVENTEDLVLMIRDMVPVTTLSVYEQISDKKHAMLMLAYNLIRGVI